MAFEASAREWLGVTVIHASGKLTLGAGGTALRDTLRLGSQGPQEVPGEYGRGGLH